MAKLNETAFRIVRRDLIEQQATVRFRLVDQYTLQHLFVMSWSTIQYTRSQLISSHIKHVLANTVSSFVYV